MNLTALFCIIEKLWIDQRTGIDDAGTLVPITGFANGVVSSAIEARTEGWILGIGTRIFAIAGPVILYGTTASMVYGLLYYFWTLFK